MTRVTFHTTKRRRGAGQLNPKRISNPFVSRKQLKRIRRKTAIQRIKAALIVYNSLISSASYLTSHALSSTNSIAEGMNLKAQTKTRTSSTKSTKSLQRRQLLRLSYSRYTSLLVIHNIGLSREILADLASLEPMAFRAIIELLQR